MDILFCGTDYGQCIPVEITFGKENVVFCDTYVDFVRNLKLSAFDLVFCDGIKRRLKCSGGDNFISPMTLVATAYAYTKNSSFIVLSTSAINEGVIDDTASLSGADVVLYKPFDKEALLEVVKSAHLKRINAPNSIDLRLAQFSKFLKELEGVADFASKETYKLRKDLKEISRGI